jgi:hypothetical protein
LMAMGASTAGGPSKHGLSTGQMSNRNQASKRRIVTTQFLKENSEAALKRIDRNNWVGSNRAVFSKVNYFSLSPRCTLAAHRHE